MVEPENLGAKLTELLLFFWLLRTDPGSGNGFWDSGLRTLLSVSEGFAKAEDRSVKNLIRHLRTKRLMLLLMMSSRSGKSKSPSQS